MPRHWLHLALIALPLASVSLSFPAAPASAQVTVFDPANYAQNLLSAARALQQVNNQIQSLQNETTMLTNMAKQLQKLDFSSLSQITSGMQKITALMTATQSGSMGFDLTSTNSAIDSLFPQDYSSSTATRTLVAQAEAQWQAAMSGYRQTLRVQAQVVQNVQSDNDLVSQLVAQSQGSQGSLQAQQAANQLTALAIKQQLQIQSLLAAQGRAAALEAARQADALAAARATTQRFVGSADIYTRP